MQEQQLASHQIKVDDDVYQELNDIGKKSETYNDIIKRLLEAYRRTHKT
jgi:predicted CopG family antitoxin